jgi:hypothetical protein
MKRRLLANETNEVQISVTTPHYFPESGYMPRVQDKGLGLWCLTLLSNIFKFHIVAINFIGGGNRMMRRKPLTCRKSLRYRGIHLSGDI